ncbi:hypothetical protein P154DRAFT_484270 [Amniculicola lignicola CBS 123094]|uniref:Zn(2)-C6 fungal-type domain-containing protein n=1 Tax=Amniculicola lignicola CBS 123094 TaxID=1392246 RepID=A0A6A5WSS2_9PLEO|nr:hypothetical protein P154DRAFT_484270 [Amniculicola lignicola CBS 123094]
MNSDSQPPHRVVPPSRRRDKPILSCNLCRRRKLKCDRQQPCKTCADRGLSLSCIYSPSGPRQTSETRAAPHNVYDRIAQLERLVTSLVEAKDGHGGDGTPPSVVSSNNHIPGSKPLPAGRNDTPPTDVPGTPDLVKMDEDEMRYTNSGHWTSVLDGIAELKEHLDDISREAELLPEPTGPILLFGRQRHATQSELLAAIPLRSEADPLVEIYFSIMQIHAALLHKPTFFREYEKFWENPYETPVIWLGLLFSMMCIGTRFQSIRDQYIGGICLEAASPLAAARMDFYREKAVQSFILANYPKCPPFAIEAFLHYFITELFRSSDTQYASFILIGIVMRMAFRAGYHRDPSRFPNIPPAQAEMRRRTWAMILQFDIQSSTQHGMPRMIQRFQYDVQEPHNLEEEDLHDDLVELPPSRPETDSTGMLYILTRGRVLDVLAQVIDLTNTPTPPAYEEVMSLDTNLREVYNSIPQSWKKVRAKDFVCEDSDDAIRRLYLVLAFLKCVMMLHRPYFLLGRTDERYEYSRQACLDAALELLEYQRMIEKESQPGGGLWSFRWKVWSLSWRLSSVINHDCLLAASILSLDLDRDLQAPIQVVQDPGSERIRFKPGRGHPLREEIIEALKGAYEIWSLASAKSQEARKVTAALELVLGKADAIAKSQESANVTLPPNTRGPQSTSFDFGSQSHVNSSQHPISLDSFPDPDNSQFVPPFPIGDIPMDFRGNFDWGDIDPDFSYPVFEQDLQGNYLG